MDSLSLQATPAFGAISEADLYDRLIELVGPAQAIAVLAEANRQAVLNLAANSSATVTGFAERPD